MEQNSDAGELEDFCKDAIAANPKAVGEFKAGNAKALNALVGPVMKASKGSVNGAISFEIKSKNPDARRIPTPIIRPIRVGMI